MFVAWCIVHVHCMCWRYLRCAADVHIHIFTLVKYLKVVLLFSLSILLTCLLVCDFLKFIYNVHVYLTLICSGPKIHRLLAPCSMASLTVPWRISTPPWTSRPFPPPLHPSTSFTVHLLLRTGESSLSRSVVPPCPLFSCVFLSLAACYWRWEGWGGGRGGGAWGSTGIYWCASSQDMGWTCGIVRAI